MLLSAFLFVFAQLDCIRGVVFLLYLYDMFSEAYDMELIIHAFMKLFRAVAGLLTSGIAVEASRL